ncbi:MAG: shikimate dehydrogenase [Bacteroidales bacterium]|nr:shikimate dehydrogenase [Bacteroidales bacterium]
MKKVFGLIGYPLDHSWSPSYFQQQFQVHGLPDHRYQLFPLKTLNDFLPLLDNIPDLCGLNVTIPYKETIIPCLDESDPRAAEIGAVNTILIRGSGPNRTLTGHNTDAEGFLRSADFSGHQSALIFGTGGASRAVCYALQKMGIRCTLVSRSGTLRKAISYKDLDDEMMSTHTLIINATPIGMYPDEGPPPPIPYHLINSHHFLYDLVYNPEETHFLKEGLKRGARIQSGLKMLHLQAELSFELFMGREPGS